jgi:hypothetical protein
MQPRPRRWLRVPWMLFTLPWHGILSVLLPILLVERAFPVPDSQPAVAASRGRRGVSRCGVQSGSWFGVQVGVVLPLAVLLCLIAVWPLRWPRIVAAEAGSEGWLGGPSLGGGGSRVRPRRAGGAGGGPGGRLAHRPHRLPRGPGGARQHHEARPARTPPPTYASGTASWAWRSRSPTTEPGHTRAKAGAGRRLAGMAEVSNPGRFPVEDAG